MNCVSLMFDWSQICICLFVFQVQNLWKTSYKLTKLFNTATTKGAFQASRSIKSSLEHFRINMPKINALCNPGIKKRHWDMMNEKVYSLYYSWDMMNEKVYSLYYSWDMMNEKVYSLYYSWDMMNEKVYSLYYSWDDFFPSYLTIDSNFPLKIVF